MDISRDQKRASSNTSFYSLIRIGFSIERFSSYKKYLKKMKRKNYNSMIVLVCFIFLSFITAGQEEGERPKTPAEVVVTVDLNTPEMVSQFEIGLTHVHNRWDRGHPEAVA